MKAAVLTGPSHMEVADRPMPSANDDQLLIRVLVCGVCSSEYHVWKEGLWGGTVLGHEAVGIVEKVGKNVAAFKPGDRVSGFITEAFAEYTVCAPERAIRLPDGIGNAEGILEPWSCLISGAGRVSMRFGADVALVGCGYMGLGFLQLLKSRGVGRILAVDVREESLENARRFGADETYKPHCVPKNYIVDEWNDQMFRNGVEVAVEAGGVASALELAGKMVRPHGTLAIVGYHQSGRREIDMRLWNWKALTVINAHERRIAMQMEYMEDAVRLMQSGRIRAKEMMTHAYPLEQINRAFAETGDKPPGYIKGYIRIAE